MVGHNKLSIALTVAIIFGGPLAVEIISIHNIFVFQSWVDASYRLFISSNEGSLFQNDDDMFGVAWHKTLYDSISIIG